ncbi:hypothetical protein CHELA1G11_21235 [Hyphomicrobiales bacterium]|nr:hypothetical protein CHELA1G11_21235 [Hyphomicrobiales bacterium]CAH1693859.1 hypothetical protein CHELA1G2_21541 [Hyphomicrobiales bacterium]
MSSREGLAGQLPASSSSVKPDDNLIHYTLDSAAVDFH